MSNLPERTKWALLIGINAYPNLTKFEQLEGCVNDVRLMAGILREGFGFAEGHINILTDEAATRDGILEAMEALLERVGKDDIVVMHYSGHGSQMTDREGDEPDGLDETIVPHDGGRAPHPNRDITDDEIYAWLNRLTAKTPFVTLIFDCCHSGTIARNMETSRSRNIEPDTRPIEDLPPSPVTGPTTRSAVHDEGPSGWLPLGKRYVLMAGCRDDESSYEYTDTEGNAPHGAMTFFLTRALAKTTSGSTYRDIFEQVSTPVTANSSRQHPQMEGSLDREVFGIHDIEPMRFVGVKQREGDTVQLAAGAAHGLTIGSEWEVYPSGTKMAEDNADKIGLLEITQVGAVASSARIVEETKSKAITAGSRAVEVAHAFGESRLRVSVHSTSEYETETTALLKLINESGLLQAVEPSEAADVRAYLIAPRESVAEEDPVPQLGPLDAPSWAVVGTDGKLVMPVHPMSKSDVHETIRGNLEKLTRYRAALLLTNPDSVSPLRDAIEVQLKRQDANGNWIDAEPEHAGGETIYEEGERLGLTVVNHHSAPVYLHILDFGLTGRIGLLYPIAGANEPLAPGASFDIGLRQGEELELQFPENFPFVTDPTDKAQDQGVETLKIFVTTAPADFSPLLQEGVRSAAAPDDSPLGALLSMALTGESTRDLRRPQKPAPDEDWTTVSRSFVLRRSTTGTSLNADGRALALDGVTLRTPGLDGQARVLPAFSARTRSVDLVTDDLQTVLDRENVSTQRTVEIEEVRTRSVTRAEPIIEVEVPDPGKDTGQFVLYTDESGVTTWHFEEPDAPKTRGAATRTYVIHRAGPVQAGEATTRGLVGSVGKKLVKLLVFPLIDPILGEVGDYFAGKWEERHRPYGLRLFTSDNYRQPVDDASLDADAWTSLAAGRALLFVHGTFSRAHSAFGGLTPDIMDKLHQQYDGRVFAFDHFTLSHDPKENVEWLLKQVPEGTSLDVDIVCHSRGGLVSRMLAEKQSEFSLGARSFRVGNVVFAASPNAGTALADAKHLGKLVDTYTNLLNFIPDNPVTDILDGVITVAKQLAVGALKGLDGLQSMQPGGEFQQGLNTAADLEHTRYYALGADYEPAEAGFRSWVVEHLTEAIFKADNDLVVPTASVYEKNGGTAFPIEERKVFESDANISHTTFFQHPHVQAQLLTWLNS